MLATALLLFPLTVVTLGENPCKEMTVAGCEIGEEVEAELRQASRGSSHTPLLPSKKVGDDNNGDADGENDDGDGKMNRVGHYHFTGSTPSR